MVVTILTLARHTLLGHTNLNYHEMLLSFSYLWVPNHRSRRRGQIGRNYSESKSETMSWFYGAMRGNPVLDDRFFQYSALKTCWVIAVSTCLPRGLFYMTSVWTRLALGSQLLPSRAARKPSFMVTLYFKITNTAVSDYFSPSHRMCSLHSIAKFV